MKTLYPDRTVVCVAGDGDFLMTGQDFATAVQYNLPVIVVIADNGLYGTIRMHQEREYPGRVVATSTAEIRISSLTRMAFGGYGALVEKTADFPAAFAAGGRDRQAVDHPSQDRSGSDHADSRRCTAIRAKALAGGHGVSRHAQKLTRSSACCFVLRESSFTRCDALSPH